MEPRCGGSAQIAERLAHDISRPGKLRRTEGSRLHHLARDLVFGGIDELNLNRVRHMLQHDEIAQALKQVSREPARLMAGLHDPIDHHEQRRAIVGRHRVDGFVEERAIGHAELRNGLCVGDTVGAASRDDLAEDREAVADAAGPGTGNEGQRRWVGRHALCRADRCQVVGEHLRRHEPEGVVVGARPDGREHFLDLCCRKDEADVVGWLLDELEQRVEACRRDHVGLVDDVDLVARRGRREHRALAQITGVFDPAVARSIKLDDIEGACTVCREIEAALALTARVRGRALRAVERPGQDSSGRGLAAAARAGEKISVVHAIVLKGAAQRARHMVLPDDGVEGRRPVGAIQSHGHVRHPNRPDRQPKKRSGPMHRQKKGPPAHPPEPTYPCCLPALGGFSEMTPHEGSA